jgi:hypothetical protein
MRLFILLLIATVAFSAPNGLYIEADVAAQSAKNDIYTTDVGVGASVALGFQYDKVRFEAQAKKFITKLDGYDTQTTNYEADGDMDVDSQFINFYYSGYNKTRLVSTIGLGVGVSEVNIKDVEIFTSAEDDVKLKKLLSYQASYSIGYMVNSHFSYVLKYNYLYIDNDKKDEFNTKSFQNHSLGIGLRYLF